MGIPTTTPETEETPVDIASEMTALETAVTEEIQGLVLQAALEAGDVNAKPETYHHVAPSSPAPFMTN